MNRGGQVYGHLQPDDIAGIRALYPATTTVNRKGNLENPSPRLGSEWGGHHFRLGV